MTLAPIKELFQSMKPQLMFELRKFHPAIWDKFRTFKRTALKDALVTNMKRGIKEGLYRGDIDVDVLAILRMEEMEMACNDEVYPLAEYGLVRVQVALLEHFLFGIASAKGHSIAEKYKKQFNING
jgi:TetR/AcrR family transcriptional regulator, cholesterol catabolism regulator